MKNIIEAAKLVFEYIHRDEEGNVESIETALDHVDLEVKPGQFVAILGHNGSGKSTLAKNINALLTPSEGTLFVAGKDALKEENIWEVRKSAGMVFQNPDNQIIASVVEEDVAFGPENMGVPEDEILSRVDKALEAVGMVAYREMSPSKLSGGQKQRVAIAGVMAMEPQCIIADESTAMLDPKGRREVMAAIKKLNSDYGMTVIFITHLMNEAAEAERIIILNGGTICADGSPSEVFSDNKLLSESGLGLPDAAVIAEQLRKKGIKLSSDICTEKQLVEQYYSYVTG